MIDYNRPSSYLSETQEFLKKITVLHEKLGTVKLENENDEKSEVIENL